jgi:hypothetical protein
MANANNTTEFDRAMSSEITIRFALERFSGAFTWTGTREEADEQIAELAAVAQSHNQKPATMLLGAMVEAPAMLQMKDPVVVRGVQLHIAAFVLQCPTHNPDYPGFVRDYVGIFDFTVTVTRLAPGAIDCRLEAKPGAVAGSA